MRAERRRQGHAHRFHLAGVRPLEAGLRREPHDPGSEAGRGGRRALPLRLARRVQLAGGPGRVFGARRCARQPVRDELGRGPPGGGGGEGVRARHRHSGRAPRREGRPRRRGRRRVCVRDRRGRERRGSELGPWSPGAGPPAGGHPAAQVRVHRPPVDRVPAEPALRPGDRDAGADRGAGVGGGGRARVGARVQRGPRGVRRGGGERAAGPRPARARGPPPRVEPASAREATERRLGRKRRAARGHCLADRRGSWSRRGPRGRGGPVRGQTGVYFGRQGTRCPRRSAHVDGRAAEELQPGPVERAPSRRNQKSHRFKVFQPGKQVNRPLFGDARPLDSLHADPR
mmetsp:Transcript_63299/g.142764  ORF Transcript_63299/g.142764 Transcript_63299/m.142764 type:complete len:344 (+) Transcript_63299:279-1310(+)